MNKGNDKNQLVKYPVLAFPGAEGKFCAFVSEVADVIITDEVEKIAVEKVSKRLITQLSLRIKEWDEIAKPSPIGRCLPAISLSSLASKKLRLYFDIKEAGLTKADMAKLLGVSDPRRVTELLDFNHETKEHEFAAAFAVLPSKRGERS